MPEVKSSRISRIYNRGYHCRMVKNVGDSVEKGEAILELETDKVNVEVVSEEEGVLQEQLASEGDTVEVGQVIATVGEGSGNASSSKKNLQTNLNLRTMTKRLKN